MEKRTAEAVRFRLRRRKARRLAFPARLCYTGRTAGEDASRPAGENRGSDVMHNELTEQDLEMMRKELDHRRLELMP